MAHILVIDDEELILFTVEDILDQAGHTVATANDGMAGVELYETQKFDLVITDMVMPNQNGTETINQIRAKSADTPIIAISGGARSRNVDFLETAKRCGASAVLAKPFSEEELINAVTACLGERGDNGRKPG